MKATSITLTGTPRDGEQLPRAFAELTRGADITCNGHTYVMVEARVMTPDGTEILTFAMDYQPGRAEQHVQDAKRLATILDGHDWRYKAVLQLIDIVKHMG